MSNESDKPDQTIQVARIGRNGQIVAAAIAAIAALIGIYVAGRQQGTEGGKMDVSSTPAVTMIVTPAPTINAIPTASKSAIPTSRTVSLLDLPVVEEFGEWQSDPVSVNSLERPETQTVAMCYQEGLRTFQLDRINGRFKSQIGLTDDSSSRRVTFRALLDGRQIFAKRVGVGELLPVDVDVSGGFRLMITADFDDICSHDVTAAWISPRIEQ